MWQDVFAVDSRVCEARFENMSAETKKDLKPIYLKRRLQLLQASHHRDQPIPTHVLSEQAEGETMSDKDTNKTVNQQISYTYQPVMRNKRYISLRVKLLKRQFGLPSDVLSLKSMSLSSPGPQASTLGQKDPDTLNENFEDVEMKSSDQPSSYNRDAIKASSSTEMSDSFNRVHQVFDSLHRSQVTRLMFTQVQTVSSENPDDIYKGFCIVSSSLDGKLSIASLDSNSTKDPSILTHPGKFSVRFSLKLYVAKYMF